MKTFRYIFLLAIMLLTVMSSFAQSEYLIVKISNPSTITIGGKTMKAGDKFLDTEQIVFSSDSQCMKVMKIGSRAVYVVNKASVRSKKAKNLKGYIANDYGKKKGSTRSFNGGNVPQVFKGAKDSIAFPERRVALVIGNSSYETLEPLETVPNDVREVSLKLASLGFDVMALYDGNLKDMVAAIDVFFNLAKDYKVAMIYFAGHGIRNNDRDYLLSVDFEECNLSQMCYIQGISEKYAEKWKKEGNVFIFVVDACRNNLSFSDDNKVYEPESGSIIFQSTSKGTEAFDIDKNGFNSPFASSFIAEIGHPGESADIEFIKVRNSVKAKTHNQQVPRQLGEIGDFVFNNTHASVSSAMAQNSAEVNVNCNVSSAKIYCDGSYLGIGGGRYPLSQGSHIITATAEGYRDYSNVVQVNGSISHRITMNAKNENDKTVALEGLSFEMVYVEGGTFTMGATSEQGVEASAEEKPTHSVTLSSFHIGETEVTQAMWMAVMGEEPMYGGWTSEYGRGDNYPAYNVSWEDCQTFIKQLNKLTGKTFRLPTEAEWEYAARGGNKSLGYKYSGSNIVDNVAMYKGEYGAYPVKGKSSNELGLYDMSGNVSEWCQDGYYRYVCDPQTNPVGNPSDSYHVWRGGSWFNAANDCRVSFRSSSRPSRRNPYLGFRLVLVQ